MMCGYIYVCFVPWRGGEITLKRTLFVQRRTLSCDFKVHFLTAVHSCYIYSIYRVFSFSFQDAFLLFRITRQRYIVSRCLSLSTGHFGYTIFYWFWCPGYGERGCRSRCCVVVLITKIGKVWMCRVCVCVWYFNVTRVYVWRWASRSHSSTLHLLRLVLLVHITRLKCLAATLNVVLSRFFRASAVTHVLLSFLCPWRPHGCPQGQCPQALLLAFTSPSLSRVGVWFCPKHFRPWFNFPDKVSELRWSITFQSCT